MSEHNNDDEREREGTSRKGIENLPPEYQELARRGANREWITLTAYEHGGNRFRIQVRTE